MYDCSSNIPICDIPVKPMEPLQKSALETMSSRVIQFISPFLELQYLRYIMIPRDLSLRLSGTYPPSGYSQGNMQREFSLSFSQPISTNWVTLPALGKIKCFFLFVHSSRSIRSAQSSLSIRSESKQNSSPSSTVLTKKENKLRLDLSEVINAVPRMTMLEINIRHFYFLFTLLEESHLTVEIILSSIFYFFTVVITL